MTLCAHCRHDAPVPGSDLCRYCADEEAADVRVEYEQLRLRDRPKVTEPQPASRFVGRDDPWPEDLF